MQDIDAARQFVREFAERLGVAVESVETSADPAAGGTVLVIRTPEEAALIGDRGEAFGAFSYLVKRIAERKFKDMPFAVDVNGYRAAAAQKLKEKAVVFANRARDMRSDVEMEPMSSYERLVIHAALAGAPGVKTESTGEGNNRRVVIKYVPETA